MRHAEGIQVLSLNVLGEGLADAGEITEFLDAFTDDLPTITSTASVFGAGLQLLQKAGCAALDDEPWFCF
jgi:hypothetical protein